MNTPAAPPPAQIPKAALRRLAMSKLEPTPENYAQAWAEECGQAGAAPLLPPRARTVLDRLAHRATDDAALRTELQRALAQGGWDEALRLIERAAAQSQGQSQAWAELIERLARGLERGGAHWTLARKKDSLQRVLDASRSDMGRLLHRLKQLSGAWDSEEPLPAEGEAAAAAAAAPESAEAPAPAAPAVAPAAPVDLTAWNRVIEPLHHTLRSVLPEDSPRARELADELAALADRIATEGASLPLAEAVADACQRARRLLSHRHHLLDQVHRLSRELADSLSELSEDDSWVQGQMHTLRASLDEAPSARAVQAAATVLTQTRLRQRDLRHERDQARHALKDLIQRMLAELGQLDEHTGRFSEGMLRYAETIERADSLESLAGVVREMVEESRSVHSLVSSTRGRLHEEHSRAVELEAKVRELEQELRRLSDEVATDQLTQVANRRGMQAQFETERARQSREGGDLAIGLLDIDNFKRLNDSLGHAAGDQALVALAQHVRQSLRPVDRVARFGGEEFVVLLPATPVDEAQKVLTRLQRELSASLFMHEGREVFVTFSAGVTAYRPGEALELALERADEALYEAKRTGKNRTCIG